MGVTKVVAALVAATFALSACSAGAAVDDQTVVPTTVPAGVEIAAPSTLVGAWGVDATGVPPGSVLRLGIDDLSPGLSMSGPGCAVDGSWRSAVGGLFTTVVVTAAGECSQYTDTGGRSVPEFLALASGFGRRAGQLVLTGADGSVVAALIAGATPVPRPNEPTEFLSVPVLTEKARFALDAPTVPLPGVRPASQAQIEGSWRPEEQKNPQSSLSFTGADARWRGSDGCNGLGGSWALAAFGGSFIAVGGASTGIGCNNDNTSSIEGASYAGFDGEVLVFGDKDGKVVGRFIRSPTPTSS